MSTTSAEFSIWAITLSVLVFLGIPLVAGFLTRLIGERRRGREWYETKFLPRISPLALGGLLFTIVMLFALQGQQVLAHPLDVARIALPLLVYFISMFVIGFATGKLIGLSYERTATLSFTAAGNNFELAIAVAIGTFGAASGEALAGIVGPLIEVPVLVGLVYVALWLRPRFGSGVAVANWNGNFASGNPDDSSTGVARIRGAASEPAVLATSPGGRGSELQD